MKEDINNIIAKELSGNASPEEMDLLREWINEEDINKTHYNVLRLNWVQGDENILESKARVFLRLSDKIGGKKEKSQPIELQPALNNPWKGWMKIAASLVLIGSLALLIYQNFQSSSDRQLAEIKMVVKETPKGVKRQIVLPDGSNVWLNSGSSLSYQTGFTDSSRHVTLVGEAYFEVSKDSSRPFRVESGEIVTTAIGTAFNVNAFSKSEMSTVSLTEGKVKVELTTSKEVVYLTPGYAAILTKGTRQLDAQAYDPGENVVWKDGILVFKNANEATVLRDLENWYGVKFLLRNKSPEKWDLTTRFENESLEHVLTVIGHKAKFEFEIEDKKVIVKYLTNENMTKREKQ